MIDFYRYKLINIFAFPQNAWWDEFYAPEEM
jgi:hypothetical protein